jgi:hypothetical protein
MYPDSKIQFYDGLDIFTFSFLNVLNFYEFNFE